MSDPEGLDAARQAIETVDRQHRERARTLSEFVSKLLAKRKGMLPKTLEEYLSDLDIVKRCAEHVGGCQAINELRISLWPAEKPPEAPRIP